MAKKNFGKFLALATISGAVAAGVSYFLKYRSFHAELDEDFHDFEGDDDDFDGTLPHEGESVSRNYVPLGEKKEETAEQAPDAAQKAEEIAEEVKEEVSQAAEETKEDTAKVKESLSDAIEKAATTIEEDTVE